MGRRCPLPHPSRGGPPLRAGRVPGRDYGAGRHRDGYRESTESWATLLRGLKRRGMRAPVPAVGDGALGFWKALRDVWPETREQRCWVHRIANVLDKLPKRLHAKAKAALHEIMRARVLFSDGGQAEGRNAA